jgi:hypothetical protein
MEIKNINLISNKVPFLELIGRTVIDPLLFSPFTKLLNSNALPPKRPIPNFFKVVVVFNVMPPRISFHDLALLSR